jgi:hypothetical protein
VAVKLLPMKSTFSVFLVTLRTGGHGKRDESEGEEGESMEEVGHDRMRLKSNEAGSGP